MWKRGRGQSVCVCVCGGSVQEKEEEKKNASFPEPQRGIRLLSLCRMRAAGGVAIADERPVCPLSFSFYLSRLEADALRSHHWAQQRHFTPPPPSAPRVSFPFFLPYWWTCLITFRVSRLLSLSLCPLPVDDWSIETGQDDDDRRRSIFQYPFEFRSRRFVEFWSTEECTGCVHVDCYRSTMDLSSILWYFADSREILQRRIVAFYIYNEYLWVSFEFIIWVVPLQFVRVWRV